MQQLESLQQQQSLIGNFGIQKVKSWCRRRFYKKIKIDHGFDTMRSILIS